MQPLLERALPDATLERTDPLGFKVYWGAEGSARRHEHGIISLDNAYQEFLAMPEDFDAIAARYVTSSQSAFAENAPLEAGQIVPMVKSVAWLRNAYPGSDEEPNNACCHDVINEELIVAYAQHADHFHFLSVHDVHAAGMTEHDLRRHAAENLRATTADFEWTGSSCIRFASAGGNFESALILRDDVFSGFAVPRDAAHLFGIPDRNSLMVAIDAEPYSVFTLARGTMQRNRSEAHPISNLVFTWRDGKITLIDDLSDDESHPIPKLDVIDIVATRKGGGARLCLMIATPLDAGPRSVYRLFRKLDGYLQYLASDGHRTECGRPEPDTTDIEITLHPHTDAQIIELIDGLRAWTEKQGVGLKRKVLNLDGAAD
ncbi:MAG TPA: hypothetical protein VKA43_06480 [Gammaproteobacteria bacterium]|nr:hypothetical protein [Gammaproteobacteria bacterium]